MVGRGCWLRVPSNSSKASRQLRAKRRKTLPQRGATEEGEDSADAIGRGPEEADRKALLEELPKGERRSPNSGERP